MFSPSEALAVFECHLTKNRFERAPQNLYEPCDYVLLAGGKRARPVALLLAFELFSAAIERALDAALAVELFHNFTLIHDDIMDAAPARRGRPTVHERWGLSAGILSGDVMLVLAYEFLLKDRDREAGFECARILTRAAREVCEGQQMDMDFERREDVSLAEYLKMIELKTAVLLGAAMQMGAVAARASVSDAQNLYEAGVAAGVAFQIQDDLLDAFGDPEKFGKQIGGDIIQNKKTFLVLKTLEIAPEPERAELRRWLSSPTKNAAEKVAAVKAIFERNGVPDLAAAEQKRLTKVTFERLAAVSAPIERKQHLAAMFESLIGRDR